MGTWALPQTKKSAEQLAAIMIKPLNAGLAENALYQIFGDDELSDQISEQVKTDGPDSDVRGLIAFRLEYFLNDYAERPEAYLCSWEPAALKICQELASFNFKITQKQ